MDRRTARYLGPLNFDNRLKLDRAGLEPKPRRWPWLAILALGFLAAGYLCGLASGRAWGREHPCKLAPGGAVKVADADGNGMLYTCSRDGEVMSRIPWVGEVAP